MHRYQGAKPRVFRKIITINTNIGWYAYYVARFNKTLSEDAAHLAMFYLACALRDGEVFDELV